MRACFLPEAILEEQQEILIMNDQFHHLVQVCRLRINDEILVLNGNGKKAFTTATSISKRELILKINRIELSPLSKKFDAVVAVPKKEALEQIIKMSIELGLRRLFLVRSTYSQERIPETSRLASLVQSAIEQSNNPWPADIVILKDWNEIPWDNYDKLICFDPTGSDGSDLRLSVSDSILTLVGPEGGFSKDEINFLQSKKSCRMIAWSTPILRAPTAFSVGVGWVTARLS